ncbi:Chondroitin proteoglycan 2-like protein [Dinothrombium tinctorium]|uniref:Chondroitin proteoglycan 2-like protein n=1 Tax=Dinothrombium tinctorium TaxID=1965070 RepID=A0A443QIJ2_9ACAR|nr:Chondroitin proteoglycan 2-like protein [Dinothrombium tinctorium]
MFRDGKLVADELCPDGTVFNTEKPNDKPACELPFGIDCSSRPKLQPPQSTERCPRLYGLFRDERVCSVFIQCTNGEAYEHSCPENLYFNDQKGVCDWSDSVDGCNLPYSLGFSCPEYKEEEYLQYGDPRFPDPSDCRKLYVCIRHVYNKQNVLLPRHLSCEEGKVYNQEIQECDYPENVRGCENYYPQTDRRVASPSSSGASRRDGGNSVIRSSLNPAAAPRSIGAGGGAANRGPVGVPTRIRGINKEDIHQI